MTITDIRPVAPVIDLTAAAQKFAEQVRTALGLDDSNIDLTNNDFDFGADLMYVLEFDDRKITVTFDEKGRVLELIVKVGTQPVLDELLRSSRNPLGAAGIVEHKGTYFVTFMDDELCGVVGLQSVIDQLMAFLPTSTTGAIGYRCFSSLEHQPGRTTVAGCSYELSLKGYFRVQSFTRSAASQLPEQRVA